MVRPDPTTPVSHQLLEYLRAEFDDPNLRYASPPAPLLGGYDTAIYRLALAGSEDARLRGPLVLRMFSATADPQRAVFEATVQNALADTGYPAPRSHLVCTESSVLGGAFFVMDLLPGDQLLAAPPDVSSTVMGTAHAVLHQLDARPIAAAIDAAGVTGYRLDDRFDSLQATAVELPWIGAAVDWLTANRPPEPPELAVCHNDFHKLNILYEDGEVTGVVDWSGFLITDPIFDVATTIVLFTISARHLTAAGDFEPADLDLVVEEYLAAYERRRPLDRTHLDYYRALRCMTLLLYWHRTDRGDQLRPMLNDFAATIRDVSGVTLELSS